MVDSASLLPPLVLVSLPVVYLGYRLYRAFAASTSSSTRPYDPKTGVGRGAPGFQTGVRRVALPAALAARIRAGEDVSAEEVTAALEAAEAEARTNAGGRAQEEDEKVKVPEGVDEEWLPAGALGKGKPAARRRARK